jgi:hypothetical protein
VATKESLKFKVLVLSETPPREAALYWRKLGERRFASVPLEHVARGVYWVELPPGANDDFEYYIRVESEDGHSTTFPSTAPRINQTVVVWR